MLILYLDDVRTDGELTDAIGTRHLGGRREQQAWSTVEGMNVKLEHGSDDPPQHSSDYTDSTWSASQSKTLDTRHDVGKPPIMPAPKFSGLVKL